MQEVFNTIADKSVKEKKMNRKRIRLIIGIVWSVLAIIVVYLLKDKSKLISNLDLVPSLILLIIGIGGYFIYPLFISIKLLIEGIKNKILQYKYLSITGIVLSLITICFNLLTLVYSINIIIPSFLHTFFYYFSYFPALYTIILSIILLVQLNKRATPIVEQPPSA